MPEPEKLEDYVPDLGVVPNFEALAGWFAKLHKWCKAAADEITSLRERNAGLFGANEKLIEENMKVGNYKARLESIAVAMEDVDRGVRDLDELKETIRDEAVVE